MTMTRCIVPALFIVLLLPLAANADLIGDEIDAGIFREDNTRITGFGLDGPFVVEAGPGDMQQYSSVFTLDVEANSFNLDYIITSPASWVPGITFQIFDLDWVNMPNGIITGLIIDTNVVGWDDSRATFDDHSATFLFGDLEIEETSFLNVEFVTEEVPEPSSAAILGACWIGAWLRRRRS